MLLRFILIAVLLLVVARLFWRVVDGLIEGVTGEPRRRVKPGVKLVRDPVCGTFVAPGESPSLTRGGRTHYFCSDKCRDEYHAR
jgi:YHS domain-containing protein